MSTYRAIKHLIGETSLERKFRMLFDVLILALIIPSFLFSSWRTEHLAYDQLKSSSRLLVPALIAEQHHAGANEAKSAEVEKAMAELRARWYEKLYPKDPTPPEPDKTGWWSRIIKP